MKALIIFCAIAIVSISAQLDFDITSIVEFIADIGDNLDGVFIDFDLEQLGVDQLNGEFQNALDLAQEYLRAEELRSLSMLKEINDAAKTVDTSVDKLREDLARSAKEEEDIIINDLDMVKNNIGYLLSTTKQ